MASLFQQFLTFFDGFVATDVGDIAERLDVTFAPSLLKNAEIYPEEE